MPNFAVTFIAALAAAIVTISPGVTASPILPFVGAPRFFGTGFVGPLTTRFATGAAVAGTSIFPFIRRAYPTVDHLAKRCAGWGWGSFPFATNTVNAFDRNSFAANCCDNTIFVNNNNANVVSNNVHALNTANVIA